MMNTSKSFIRQLCLRLLPKKLRVTGCLLVYGMMAMYASSAYADTVAEYTLKAAFLYNFAAFTTWPNRSTENFNLCIYGQDPFGNNLDALMRAKRINEQPINIHRINQLDHLAQCQLVFISRPAIGNITTIIDAISNKPVLTVADSPEAARQGVVINMNVIEDKVTFEANLLMAKKAGLNLSSQLLRLATEIYQ